MKKLFVILTCIFICVTLFLSCNSAHKENVWFSDEKLSQCLVGDLPAIEKDYINHNGEDIYVSFTSKEREAYLAEVFEYLKTQNFKYLGTRGEQASTLAGSFTTYYFKSATELSEFYVGSSYKFVYSDGTLDEGGGPIFCILTIYDYEAKNLEYGTKNFAYNTLITLRYKQEAPLSGRYALNDEECNHEWDDGIEVEGGSGCYVMEYTCTLCGDKKRETITIIPPENHFLRNQAGCEWLNELSADDIAEIKIISEAVSVAPGNLKNIQSSTDEAVIARIFEEYYWLDTAPISKMDGQIDGGSGVTIKFILKNGTTKELYVNNGNYRDTNGDYFELLFTPKFKDTDNAVKCYGFITYIGTGTVYDKDNSPACEIPIDELEFVESDGCVDAVVTGYYYTVATEFGTLWFDYSNDLFYLRYNEGNNDYREYYRIVGKNLDELIAKYSISLESYSISYQSDRTAELLMEGFAPISAKPGDTVVLRTNPLMDADLAFYANDIKLTQTYADSDYWEYVFIMPDEDVVITHEITDGFLPN